MINKYANKLGVPFMYAPWHKHKHGINIFLSEKIFLKRNKQGESFICLKRCKMNNFFSSPGVMCIFYQT